MNRRGFLKRTGLATAGIAAAFVPFVHADSRVAISQPKIKLAKHRQSHRYIFVSKYSYLRIQATKAKALQFVDGVYRTDNDAEAAVIRRTRRQDERTLTYDVVEFGKERIPAAWYGRGGSAWE